MKFRSPSGHIIFGPPHSKVYITSLWGVYPKVLMALAQNRREISILSNRLGEKSQKPHFKPGIFKTGIKHGFETFLLNGSTKFSFLDYFELVPPRPLDRHPTSHQLKHFQFSHFQGESKFLISLEGNPKLLFVFTLSTYMPFTAHRPKGTIHKMYKHNHARTVFLPSSPERNIILSYT